MKRTKQQIIKTIQAEVEGAIEAIGYFDENIISKMLNKRYNPNTIAEALQQRR